MSAKEITPQSLFKELDRICVVMCVILAGSWFFAAFSY